MAPKKGAKKQAEEPEEPPAPLVGKFYYKTGATYEGEYAYKPKLDESGQPIPPADGEPPPPKIRQGKGEYVEPGGNTYNGEWKDDKCHGKGIFKFVSGATYEGDWIENKYHGRGTYTFPDGSKYEGELENNAFHGQGVYTDKEGHQWSGHFFNGSGPGLVNLL
uniref:Morn repeat-containing protein 2 n=1 Tax=Tetraselmis sp. GSL018 TaxID=582737 RepID=A0A061SJW1_9CHLO|mmetsp:Transcript_17018/g.40600  ORF Transcript_17018/g.40600 Transcript_17018/m.40600 type:complete len:163 (+) Transcript_17018:148-636(+)|eukprot:CAMPEP_0177584656 /NCGR_PEP_ID=MMETSP0419_2-20121207/4024_1 /TAXON_ID=582737 /ORGANISM="Tetraselmis sp., Strain GSL018" /LENGTH=162 /DNA_ID=CAMNT_0019074233 /DNA_START=80 /DNA_END=568 /DNA_ORIENTATION=-